MILIHLKVTKLKLSSLYNYFQVYFDYPKSVGKASIAYAKAISDVMKVTNNMMVKKSIEPKTDYEKFKHHRIVAIKLLNNLHNYTISHYKNPFNEIRYISADICINKKLLKDGRIELKIPIKCGIDIKRNTIIFLAFSSKNNMKQEMEVFKGLLKEFDILNGTIPEIQTAAYWDLNKMTVEKLDYKSIEPVSRDKLIYAANKYIEIQQEKKRIKHQLNLTPKKGF